MTWRPGEPQGHVLGAVPGGRRRGLLPPRVPGRTPSRARALARPRCASPHPWACRQGPRRRSVPPDPAAAAHATGTGCGDGVRGWPLNPFVELKASLRQGPGGVSELRRESPGDMLPEAPGRWTRQVLEKRLRRHPRRLGGWKNPVNFQEQSAGPQARVGRCGMRETAE